MTETAVEISMTSFRARASLSSSIEAWAAALRSSERCMESPPRRASSIWRVRYATYQRTQAMRSYFPRATFGKSFSFVSRLIQRSETAKSSATWESVTMRFRVRLDIQHVDGFTCDFQKNQGYRIELPKFNPEICTDPALVSNPQWKRRWKDP